MFTFFRLLKTCLLTVIVFSCVRADQDEPMASPKRSSLYDAMMQDVSVKIFYDDLTPEKKQEFEETLDKIQIFLLTALEDINVLVSTSEIMAQFRKECPGQRLDLAISLAFDRKRSPVDNPVVAANEA